MSGCRLFGCKCGELTAPRASMGDQRPGEGVYPLPFYVIEHPRGIVLFDCGVHEGFADPASPQSAAAAAFGMRVSLPAEQTTRARLEALDIDPGDVSLIVLSHLHFDHAGGLDQAPNAEIVIQEAEWRAAHDEAMIRRYGYQGPPADDGRPIRRIEGEHDLFGDGRIICTPSFGHTPGHQSLRVRSDAGDYLLTADACYDAAARAQRSFPAYSDAAAMNSALDVLLASCASDTVIVYGHDGAQWDAPAVLPTARP